MTTEDDFHLALDKRPEDWQTRLVLSDWLQERNDPRAEGYRALGHLRRVPTWAFNQPSGRKPWYLWVSAGHIEWLVGGANSSLTKMADALMAATLPADWCRRMYLGAPEERREGWNYRRGWCGYATSRREAEDAAALAFSKLPAGRRAELLAPPAPEKPSKSQKPAAQKRKK